MDARHRFPPKLKGLFKPYRYKILYGGRGSAKSWSVARALLILGANSRLRILCTREIQKSIKDSVHKLLADQIEKLGLTGFYDVLETTIRGKNGTEFLFAGLSGQTADSIKSFEGVDIVWVEEAQTVIKKSWDILIPTIRKDESEIWVTFNPVLDTDDTYVRFVVHPPPNSFVCFINYHDNKWFPSVLEQERLHCKATQSEDDYNNIWEGLCRAAVAGAIFATEYAQAVADNRVTILPYDPALKVHTIWDLGFADNMAIIMAQRARSEVRIIDYMQVNYTTTDKCAAALAAKAYNWGYDFLPHDGFSKERKVGISDAEILQRFGRKVKRIPRTDEESRIKNARSVFPRVVMDREKTTQLQECLKRYRRGDNIHGADTSPIHDEFSHGADAFGYMCQVINEMTNEVDVMASQQFPSWGTTTPGMGY